MKKSPYLFVLLLLLSVSIISFLQIEEVTAEPKTIVVPDDYASIQEAIDNAGEGDTVLVKSGTYYNQTVSINKPLSLIGEDSQTTILKSRPEVTSFMLPNITSVVEVKADNIRISGFTIDHYDRGISGSGNGTQIINNIFTANWDHTSINVFGSYIEIANNRIYGGRSNTGIHIGGSYNTITDNEIVGTSAGIRLWGNSGTVSGNELIDSDHGISVSGNLHAITQNNIIGGEIGLALICSGCVIFENNITEQTERAIWVDNTAKDNVIRGNLLAPNQGYAVYLTVLTGIAGPINNTLYHNTIMGDGHNVHFTGYNQLNFWDSGYTSGGNYWSDYNGTDNDGDGIGDTPYVIDESNQDNYPLMELYTIPENPTLPTLPYAPFDLFPEPGSIDVPLDTNISISISRPPSIVNMSISPEVAVKERIDEVIDYNGRYTFILSELLEPNTTYSVTMDFGDKGAPEGFAPTSTKTWNFTTVAEAGTDFPIIEVTLAVSVIVVVFVVLYYSRRKLKL